MTPTRSIQTNQNILETIEITSSGIDYVADAWRIDYRKTSRALFGGEALSNVSSRILLVDRPAVEEIDIDGNTTTIPAKTEYTDFLATWSDASEIGERSLDAVFEKLGLVEWVDPSDDISNEPDFGEVKSWSDNLGEFVILGQKREFLGVIYDVVQPHTTRIGYEPSVTPALWTVSLDQGDGNKPEWVQPTGAQDAYPLGAQVTKDGLCYESAIEANVFEPGGTGIGDNIWFEIPC